MTHLLFSVYGIWPKPSLVLSRVLKSEPYIVWLAQARKRIVEGRIRLGRNGKGAIRVSGKKRICDVASGLGVGLALGLETGLD